MLSLLGLYIIITAKNYANPEPFRRQGVIDLSADSDEEEKHKGVQLQEGEFPVMLYECELTLHVYVTRLLFELIADPAVKVRSIVHV